MRWSDGLHQAVITWTGVTRSGQDGSRGVRIVPSIVFDHVSQFNDEFSLLVFLRCFESMLILPSKGSFATGTMDVSHCMKSSQKNPFLSWTTANIHNGIEQVGASLAPLEWLGDQLVVVSKVGSTVDTWINAMRVGRKVGLKSLHHDFFSLVWISSHLYVFLLACMYLYVFLPVCMYVSSLEFSKVGNYIISCDEEKMEIQGFHVTLFSSTSIWCCQRQDHIDGTAGEVKEEYGVCCVQYLTGEEQQSCDFSLFSLSIPASSLSHLDNQEMKRVNCL